MVAGGGARCQGVALGGGGSGWGFGPSRVMMGGVLVVVGEGLGCGLG
jgi:hypothetical protein